MVLDAGVKTDISKSACSSAKEHMSFYFPGNVIRSMRGFHVSWQKEIGLFYTRLAVSVVVEPSQRF